MRDGAKLARRGIPAVALVTDHFAEQGDFVARSVGLPDLPRLQLPHPVAIDGEKENQGADGDHGDDDLRCEERLTRPFQSIAAAKRAVRNETAVGGLAVGRSVGSDGRRRTLTSLGARGSLRTNSEPRGSTGACRCRFRDIYRRVVLTSTFCTFARRWGPYTCPNRGDDASMWTGSVNATPSGWIYVA